MASSTASRNNDYPQQMSVRRVVADDHCRACFADFAADCRIKLQLGQRRKAGLVLSRHVKTKHVPHAGGRAQQHEFFNALQMLGQGFAKVLGFRPRGLACWPLPKKLMRVSGGELEEG